MTSPMLTVVVLAVLWLIVVVPMIVRRKDERAGERSVARFGSAMRALSSRRSSALAPEEAEFDSEDLARSEPAIHVSGAVNRRPVPASKESLMYPPDRNDMSEARRQMMTRRRRSLTGLGGAGVLFLLVALVTGSMLVWVLELLVLASLSGYVLFLRSQARRDRERRASRLQRATTSRAVDGYDATAEAPRLVRRLDSAVRIDEDDVDLDHLDTVDLTGLYSEVEFDDVQIRRAG
ncbi:MAG: hypothetical protein JWM76_4135 [Pseudonocardiales bacterium]|nr:hypothetical protein [Pseudonocardiales bacterium]